VIFISWITQSITFIRDLSSFIGGAEKNRFIFVGILMTVVAGLQTLTVGSIIPLINVLAEEDVEQSAWLPQLKSILNTTDTNEVIFLLLLFIFCLLVINNILSAISIYQQVNLAHRLMVRVGKQVLSGYLYQDYSFFLSQNSAILLKNITTETTSFSAGLILNLLLVMSNCMIVIFLITFLLAIDPLTNGLVIVIGMLISVAVYRLLGNRIRTWGMARTELLGLVNKSAHQSLSGIKEIKAINGEDAYIDQYTNYIQGYATVNTKYQTSTSMTALLVDGVLTICFLLLIIYAAVSQNSLTDFIFGIATNAVILVAAMYRILPAFSAILGNIIAIRYYIPSFYTIRDAVEDTQWQARHSVVPNKGLETINEFEMRQVSFRYPNSELYAIQNLNFTIQKGMIHALIGESGSGKTTSVDLILGLLSPTEGQLLANSQPISQQELPLWRQHIGYVSQQIFLADTTLRENIALAVPPKDIIDADIMTALDLAGLRKVFDKLPQGLDTPLGENGVRLSGGERQRVGIARALYRNPDILVLDEATSSLDSHIEKEILDDIYQLRGKVTILIITHKLTTVQATDMIHFLDNGRHVDSGTFQYLSTTHEKFASLVVGHK